MANLVRQPAPQNPRQDTCANSRRPRRQRTAAETRVSRKPRGGGQRELDLAKRTAVTKANAAQRRLAVVVSCGGRFGKTSTRTRTSNPSQRSGPCAQQNVSP